MMAPASEAWGYSPDAARATSLQLDGEAQIVLVGTTLADPLVNAPFRFMRSHAKVLCTGDDWYVRDMESLNGTKVNGNTIANQTRLRDGDRVCVGDTVLVFRMRHTASTSRRGGTSRN